MGRRRVNNNPKPVGYGTACSGCVSFILTLVGLIIFLSGGNPRLRLSSATLETLKYVNSSNSSSESSSPSFLLVFNAEFAVKNKNLIEAKLRSTVATILYSGVEIGSVPINGLSVGRRSTERFNMTVYVESDKVPSNQTDQLFREMISSKNLTLIAFAKFKTEVNWILKKSAKMNCSFIVDTVTRQVIPLKCK